MPNAAKRARIELLIEASQTLEDRISTWQDEQESTDKEIRAVRWAYVEWFTRALREIIDEVAAAKFRDVCRRPPSRRVRF